MILREGGNVLCCAVLVAAVAVVQASDSEGWDNRSETRTLGERTDRIFWEARFDGGEGSFAVEKRDGAEGEVSFSGGRMTVRKTNAAGYILITAKDTFSRPVGAKLKSFADAEVSGADPLYSLAFPRVLDSKKRLTACWPLDAERVFMGGGEKIAYLANTAPGVAERRFSNFIVGDGGTDLTAALVVAGAPSVTVWRRWGVEDYDAANAAWEKYRANFTTAGAGKTNFEDSVAFERRLAGDFEHSAKVVRFGGRVRFLVDGKDTPPVIYKNPYSWGQKWGDFDGRGFAREGVKIQSFQVGCARHWTNGAWNVEATMRDIRDMMRVSPEALVVLSFNASAPKEYAESHPDEIWRNPDGTPCVGKWEHMYSRHYSSANKKPYREGCWPWVSHSSKVYLAYMKEVLGEIIARLKQEGLSKRVVGFHFCGWHDAQFAPYRPDFSAPAKEGFREFLAEKYGKAPENLELPVPGTEPFLDPEKDALAHDFNVYLHLAPFRFQEELARHAKRRFGKEIVCMHWCMGPFTGEMPGAFYLDAFLKSDVMDALVAQPSYVRRLPGNPVGNSLPLASFTRRGKLYIDELDLRAWGEIPTYVREESMGGLGFAMDLPEWEAVNRKMAGRMIAAGHGFWYYDISGGFYNPEGIKEDIGAGVRTYADLRRGAASRWRPSAAVVVDTEGMLWSNLIGQPKHPNGRAVVNGQLGLLAASAVPFDVWTYENASQSAAALAARKVVVLAGFYRLDEQRRAFLESLAARGATLVFLAGTDGFRKNLRKEGAFPRIVAEDKTRECDFLSRFHADWMRWSLGIRGGELAFSYMPPSWSFDEKPGTTVLARYADDGKPAVIRRGNAIVIGQAAGLTPRFFNRIVREAGGYVPVEKGLQVDMSGEFASVVALESGHFDFRLPFPCKVTNLKTGKKVATKGAVLPLDLVAGEVRWYALDTSRGKGSDLERVKVAAAGSSEAAKAAADYVCKGTNDQEVLQLAIDECAKDGRNLFLYDGVYMIDAFSEANDEGSPAAVVIPAMQRHFVIEGQNFSQGGYFTSPSNGVVWYARSSIWDTVETNDVPTVLRGEWARNGIGSQYGSGLRIKNLSISICDAQHPARCVDLRCNDGVEVMNMRLRGMGDRWMRGDSWPFYKFGPLPMPHIDSIGITMTGGSNVPIARFDNIIANGFGQAFQVGGEHVIFNNCLSSYNLYGWTFGNYRFGLPVGAADNHPIVLINCGDEQSVHLPLFVKCGDKGGRIHGLQSVTMIGMNFERVPGQTIGGKTGDNMRETIPGSWRGHIEYTMQPEWGATNGVHQALWEEDGSGSGFTTRNLAHRDIGTSSERRTYYPQLGQKYFDTDLGKLLICTDPAKRKWVDALGNVVDTSGNDTWAKYVPEFNSKDEELYTNAVPNSQAEAFLRENAPSFTCPDKDIERTYHFRWWTYRKHIKKSSDGGRVVTEFLPPVPWAGPENTINCAMGHHLREGRWLADASITWEYLKFMLENGRVYGPRAYSCWPAVSLLDWLDVTGDTQRALALKPLLEQSFAAWEKGWTMKSGRWFWWWPGFWYRIGKDDCGLFEITDNFEGTEMSLGGAGYRPLVNSAMYGEAMALSRLCRIAGEEDKASEYARKAAELEAKIKKSLWNAEREFFTTMRTDSVQSPVRELHGYAPWYFGMPLDGYEKAWSPIMREDGFRAPFGLTFPERSAKGFTIAYEGHECQWNGPSWPFATSIALTALAKHLQGSGAKGTPDGTFAELLSQYARQHRRRLADGTEIPWIDENVNPFTGDWISRTIILNTPEMRECFAKERGKDYNHSTFCDLVISGLVGFLPRADGTFDVKPLAPREWEWFSLKNLRHCGHVVDIDYRKKQGLVVKVDGKAVQTR